MTDPEKHVLKEYDDFLLLFQEVNANKLLPYQLYNHKILLKEGFEQHFRPLNCLYQPEPEEVKKCVQGNLAKCFIRESIAPYVALILFVKKKEKGFQLCMDFQKLTEEILKNGYLLPLMQDMLMQLSITRWLTKLDVCNAYNLLRIVSYNE